jgi:hypothetical protein
VTTRIIVHPVPAGDLGDKPWTAYIQGQDPLPVATIGELNDRLRELEVQDPEFLGCVTGCQYSSLFKPCFSAAERTIVWSEPTGYHLRSACGEHFEASARVATEAGFSYAVISDPIPVQQSVYPRSNAHDMAALARILVGHDIPARVFCQPVCAQCGARVCLVPGTAHWADADGSLQCGDGGEERQHEPSAEVVAGTLAPQPEPAPA